MPNQNLSQQIKKLHYRVFSCTDFLNYGEGSYKSISKGLERLTKQGKIKRIAEGLYGIPAFNDVLQIEEPFEKEEIVEALARKFGWKVAPAGVSALHALGLSHQVPNASVYVSTGPYRKYKIQNFELFFKHSFGKEISEFSPLSNTFYQALKELGPKNEYSSYIRSLVRELSPKEQETLKEESKHFAAWMNEYFKAVLK
jgi:predicted transcriptional regulator of viral defense system